jgi:hypothetical protein
VAVSHSRIPLIHQRDDQARGACDSGKHHCQQQSSRQSATRCRSTSLGTMITLLGNGSAILLHGRVCNVDGGSMRPRYGAASDCVAPGCRRCSVRLTGESLGPFGYESQSTPSGVASGSETTSLRRARNRGRAPRIVRARGARAAMPSWVRFMCRKGILRPQVILRLLSKREDPIRPARVSRLIRWSTWRQT